MKTKWSLSDLRALEKKGMITPGALEKPKPRLIKLNQEDCQQVQWMHWQFHAWRLETGRNFEKEYGFHPERKWRFDFAIPENMIAIEYEGLGSEKSRHTTLKGYTGDTEKYNEAARLGWRVIRFTILNYKELWTVLREI